MATGLDQHALASVDQDDGTIGCRCAGDHVARVLLVTRAICDDELAFLRREKAIGDIDRNALFALGSEPVDQQRKVDVLTLGPDPPAVVFQSGELVFEDHLGIVQQATDQGGFTVIHAAASDEAQHRFVLMLLQIGFDIFGDQSIGLINRIGHQK